MDYKQEEINKQTLDAYLNEIKELRDTVKRLKEERLVLLGEIQRIKVDYPFWKQSIGK